MRPRIICLTLSFAACAACGGSNVDTTSDDSGAPDASTDSSLSDSRVDSSRDAGSDAAADSSIDATADSSRGDTATSTDTGADGTGTDTSADSALDAPTDTTTAPETSVADTPTSDTPASDTATSDAPTSDTALDTSGADLGIDAVVDAACSGATHNCGGVCVSSADSATCGTSCTPCSAPTHATPTCDGTSCGFTCDSGFVRSSSTCTPAAPRLVFPMSTARTTSQKPVFKWQLAAGTTGAHVDVCSDRACTTIVTSFDATGGSGSPAVNLPAGVVYWRAFGSVGGLTGTIATPTWEVLVSARSATNVTAYGAIHDWNGDGAADVRALASPTKVLYGSPSGAPLTTPPFLLGDVGLTDDAMDVNGDGFADLVVQSADASGGAYFAVYDGGAAGLPSARSQRIVDGGTASTAFAMGGGDTNGDGYADVLATVDIGAGAISLGVYPGSASGVASSTSVVLTGAPSVLYLDAVTHGDFNGDGIEDVLVGDPQFKTAGGITSGRACVYYGGTTGLATVPVIITAPTPAGSSTGQFGFAAASTGDFNGDGYADVLLRDEGPSQRVYAYYGGVAGLHPTPDVTIAVSVDGYGLAIADTNGDGYSDAVIASNATDAASDKSFGVYRGGAGGLATTPAQVGYQPSPGNWYSVAAFDFNADHDEDVALGYTRFSDGESFILVFPSSASGTATTPTESIDLGSTSRPSLR